MGDQVVSSQANSLEKVMVVATGNPGKLKEMQAYLAGTGWSLVLKPETLEVEETGTTFAENACLKATVIAQATGQWSIADDSGLEVLALGGAPGVFSARYGQSDGDRIGRLLTELGDGGDRRARFVCVIAVANPAGEVVFQVEGVCPGEILLERRGTGGFGYDPIFYVPERGKTFAEMSVAEKREVSHRGRAFEALLPLLGGWAGS